MEHQLRIAEIEVLNSSQTEKIIGLFRHDPDTPQKKNSALLLVAEIQSSLYAYEQWLERLNGALESIRHHMAAMDADPMARFEKIVQHLNETSAKFTDEEPTQMAWNRISAFIFELVDDHICIAGTGQLANIFLQHQEDGSYRSFDLLGSLEQPSTTDPQKPFASLICGEMKVGDRLFIGTRNFERMRGELDLYTILKRLPPVSAAQEIREQLLRRDIPDDFAGVVIASVHRQEPMTTESPKTPTPIHVDSIKKMHEDAEQTQKTMAPAAHLTDAPKTIKRLFHQTYQNIRAGLTRHPKPVQTTNHLAHPVTLASLRGMNSGVGTLLDSKKKQRILLALGITVTCLVIGFFVRQHQLFKAEQAVWNAAYDEANRLRTDVETSSIFNEDRARTALAQADRIITQLDEKTTDRKNAKQTLVNSLTELRNKLKREITVQPKSIFALADDAPTNSLAGLVQVGSVLFTADNAAKTILVINLATNETTRISFPEGITRLTQAAGSNQHAYFTTETRELVSVNTNKAERVRWVGTHVTSSQAITIYNRRLYSLDPTHQAIWKYAPQEGGFGGETPYLTMPESRLAQATDLAIDASIYVPTEHGSILRFLLGVTDRWSNSQIDPPLETTNDIWTTPHTDRIFVSDPTNKRIVIFQKDGRLLEQLKSDALTEPRSLTSDDQGKKVYTLNGNRILLIELP